MSAKETGALAKLIADHEAKISSEWLSNLKQAGALATGRIRESELAAQCANFITLFREALAIGGTDVNHASYAPVREFLAEVSRSRALQGFSPTETAVFVFSLKEPIFAALNRDKSIAPAALAAMVWSATACLDQLGLVTFEAYQRGREEVILRQHTEIAELSTPVVRLWEGILALPIIGTLDSERTQVVMETLLQHIVDDGAEIAIIDITGVPTVDTLTAQHLLKTVSAARLMGADCIISGIRPQIAQTIVHLGVELNVVSKATLADAFAIALRRTGRAVTRQKNAEAEKQKTNEKGD